MKPFLIVLFLIAVFLIIGWLSLQIKTRLFGQPYISYATWLEHGKPWAALTLKKNQINLDVRKYIRQRGK